MKTKLLLLCLVVLSLFFTQCTTDSTNEVPDSSLIEHHYPDEITIVGENFAKAINQVAKEDLANRSGDVESRKSELGDKKELIGKKMMNSLEASDMHNFSKEQLNILRLLAVTKKSSRSYIEFSNRLSIINEKIYNTVPKSEQKELLQITGLLYYGLKEINELAKEGIIAGRPEGVNNGLTLSRIKLGLDTAYAQSEGVEDYDNDSWWNDNSWLTSVWAVALVEPTPVGEAVAAVVTIGVATYYILTRADCIDEYEDCIQFSPDPRNCYDCFRYCTAQGVWNCN